MPPHTKRQPEAAWLQRKAMIEKLFLREGKSQAETRQMLEEDGFYVRHVYFPLPSGPSVNIK